MRARHQERGQVLPLIALCLAVLMGFAGIAVDVGYWEYQQREQQNAADAAALGGAQQLLYSTTGCPNQSAANTAGQADAANNGFANGGNTTVTIANPSTIGTYAGQSCAVSALITRKGVGSWFTRLFGFAKGATETTQAVATLTANSSGCIYLLSASTSTNFNGANVQSPSCGILINDTANFNGATVNAKSIGYAGAAPNENGATFTNASPAQMLPVLDPCPEIAGCGYVTSNPPALTNCQNVNDNGLTVTFPGGATPTCFNNLNLNGATATFKPGLYIFNGGTNFNGASLSGSGVTFYVTANGTPPNFNGVSSANFTPPTSGNYTGVLYYQVPSNTQSPNFNGANVSFSGLVYAPGATSVNFNGASGGYLVLVVGAANFNGSSAYDFGQPPAGGSLIKTAVLAQ
ncbi:MAG: pilus assembly protein TadG-related protein [Candidatus Cybelea sp.]